MSIPSHRVHDPSPGEIRPCSRPFGITLWILACTYLTCAGWILSAFHQLNVAGYLAAVAIGVVAGATWCKRGSAPGTPSQHLRKLRRRFRRFFPCAFLVVAVMAFLGGALHAPSNYDALSYRVPRILHWLAAGQWHWIHTDFQRLNVRATGIEWISAPLIALFKIDRLLFLINIVSFMLLPGLVFSAFTRLGVKPRATSYWMWLMPTGYCFLLQAGSIGNDLFGAVFALAAFDFALRASGERRIKDLWLCIFAGALLTGGKTSNFPLLLPIGIALLPAVPLIKKRFVATVGVGMVAALASFLPIAVSNFMHCGDWSGQAAEHALFMKGSPGLHVTQNVMLLAVQNLTPPIFPWANQWNRAVAGLIPEERRKILEKTFEPGGAKLSVGELALEEDSGLGFGVTLLLLVTFAITFFGKRVSPSPMLQRFTVFQTCIFGALLISVVPYLWVSGSTTAGRLLTPYYCLIVPFFLLWQSGDWIRKNCWWRFAGGLVFLLAAMILILSPARPLWPADAMLSKLNSGNSALLMRAKTVYSVYGERADGFAPVREQLPAGTSVLGFVSFDSPETSLWRPFGARRIEHITDADTVANLRERGIEYALVSPEYVIEQRGSDLTKWCADHDAEIVKIIPLQLRASRSAEDWALVRIRPAGTKGL